MLEGPVGSEPEERAIEELFYIPPRPERVVLRPANPHPIIITRLCNHSGDPCPACDPRT